MKYKNNKSAIHNFGHSFVSLMNYIDEDYVVDIISEIHHQGYDIEINWLTREFGPAQNQESIGYWADSLKKNCSSHNVNLDSLSSLLLVWPAGQSKYMQAIDDKGTEHKIYINEAS